MLMLELFIKLCSVIPFVLFELFPQSIRFKLRSPPIIMLLCVLQILRMPSILYLLHGRL
jgi:hypothetical protein